MLSENLKVVCIGGGTGMSTMLRGIKEHTKNLVAVVAVSDNGGHSGVLRKDLNILPPGDIRNCLLALAETEPIMDQLFQYRFTEGTLSGHNIGNLFIAALTDICGGFELAVEKATQVLAVKGKVLPVTTENIQLVAIHKDGKHTLGESEIVIESKVMNNPIVSVSLMPTHPKAYEEAVREIIEADIVILGPGSLYTSIIPNLMVVGIKEAIIASKAQTYYVSNIMTQPGETDGFTLSQHVHEIEKYIGIRTIDKIIVNTEPIDEKHLLLYEEEGAKQVVIDYGGLNGYNIVSGNLVHVNEINQYIRHNADYLADLIMQQRS